MTHALQLRDRGKGRAHQRSDLPLSRQEAIVWSGRIVVGNSFVEAAGFVLRNSIGKWVFNKLCAKIRVLPCPTKFIVKRVARQDGSAIQDGHATTRTLD